MINYQSKYIDLGLHHSLFITHSWVIYKSLTFKSTIISQVMTYTDMFGLESNKLTDKVRFVSEVNASFIKLCIIL